MFYERFSIRRRGIIDGIAYAVFFLPTMALLFYISLTEFFYAWSIDERSNLTPWQPLIWPLRGVIPLTALLLFLQGVSELLKSVWAARTGEVLTQHENIQI
jgi:TRAP-type mannitol/chloroaromatic compound transport system permease small subunit